MPFISALLVLDSEGGRVAVKYFDPAIVGSAAAGKPQSDQLKTQLAFEKKVFAKTVRGQPRQEGYDTIREC